MDPRRPWGLRAVRVRSFSTSLARTGVARIESFPRPKNILVVASALWPRVVIHVSQLTAAVVGSYWGGFDTRSMRGN